MRIPGFPTIIGPFGFTDLRASLSWSLVDVKSLRNYLAARHNFAAAQLSAQDARDMVVLTVGNAYLLVLADETQVAAWRRRWRRRRFRWTRRSPITRRERRRCWMSCGRGWITRSLEQQLIVAQNALEKDKLALARTIGLPLAQKFNLTDKAPYAAFDEMDVDATIREAHANRKDLAAMVEADQGGRRPAQGCDGRPAAHAEV